MLTITEIIDLAAKYAERFLDFTTHTSDHEFNTTLNQLQQACEEDYELAAYFILSLTRSENTSSRHLENIHHKEKIAAALLDYADNHFIGYCLRSKLPMEMLFNYLTITQNHDIVDNRRYAFNVALEHFVTPDPEDGGVGLDFSCEAGYLFYFNAHEVAALRPELIRLAERVRHHLAGEPEVSFGEKDVSSIHRTFGNQTVSSAAHYLNNIQPGKLTRN